MSGLKSTETTVLTSRMTAPPSTAYKIVNVPELYADVIKQHGVPGAFVGSSERESPWVPFGPNAAIRHLHFDPRNNIYSNVLWIKSASVIGTHKHRGTVVMMSWKAAPGISNTIGLPALVTSSTRRRV